MATPQCRAAAGPPARLVRACRNPSRSSKMAARASTEGSSPRSAPLLAGGDFWWLRNASSDQTLVYGTNFVVQRAKVVIDTECFEVPPPANNTATGIIWLGSGDAVAEDAGPARGGHPRRTRHIRFTCNLCGESSTKAVNPHAWKTGSVFARCDGCTVVHKLKDNLKIFHELKGPVFPPRHMRGSFMVQELLDKIAAKRAAQDFGRDGPTQG